MKEIILSPWPWYVAGPLIALVMVTLIWFGKQFGISGNLRTLCAAGGGSHLSEFFRFNWKNDMWNLVFVVGTIIGGFIASNYLTGGSEISISSQSLMALSKLGISAPEGNYLPPELFDASRLLSIHGLLLLIGGGFLVGFGARYAGGCTSGHAISGLSNLQWPSLLAVIGFFIGGLTMTYFLFPIIFS